ncbi:MAG: molybdopterin biosynthesis protein [Treponema sp.]|nr:molybdopterin biosynthesis protein [Treponema sp.]
MAERNLYLSNIPAEDALNKFFSSLEGCLAPKFEIIQTGNSLDRVTSRAIYARLSSPMYNAAAMDGIAVKASATIGARESSPLVLKAGKDFIIIDTGDPVYHPFDAVIMAEDLIQTENSDDVKILESARAWQHIRPIGEDITAGEMIIPSRHKIRPIDIGVLFSGGITSLEVFSKPKAAIFPTGTEIIDISGINDSDINNNSLLKDGAVIESNTRMFEALIIQEGGAPVRFAPVPDDRDLLKENILKAADEFDIVIINAGSSAGTEDFTVHVLREIGEVIVHGVAMKPGKPVILAKVNNKPVIGAPGYPVSAYLAYETFVSPVLSVLAGGMEKSVIKTEAVVSRRIVSSLKHREYVRVKAGRVNGRLVVSPLARGAGAAMSLVRADGFCVIEQHSEGIEAGETAEVALYRSLEEIDHTLVAVGSHDLILDVIADMMSSNVTAKNNASKMTCASLASSHVGSMAGLTALKRGECHLAPVHLLDEETGNYNISWIKKILFDSSVNDNINRSHNAANDNKRDVCLIKGVGRIQGLIIQKGNPLGIKSIANLRGRRFINRQRGAGTRLFFDYLLKKEGIDPKNIDGYEREAVTHMAVAAAVQSASADAGIGIASAAKAFNLDFIPLGEEEYDFAVCSDSLNTREMEVFIGILKSTEFHEKLYELGQPLDAYTWNRAGEIVAII